MHDIPKHKLEETAKLQKEVEAFIKKKAVPKAEKGAVTKPGLDSKALKRAYEARKIGKIRLK
jgi:hypothetical protein